MLNKKKQKKTAKQTSKQTNKQKNRPILQPVLNNCPDKTKEYVHRDIRTNKLLCLGIQSLCFPNKMTQKTAREVSMCKFIDEAVQEIFVEMIAKKLDAYMQYKNFSKYYNLRALPDNLPLKFFKYTKSFSCCVFLKLNY